MKMWQYRFDKLSVRLPNYFDLTYYIALMYVAVGENKETAPNNGIGYNQITVNGHATSPHAIPSDIDNVRLALNTAFDNYKRNNKIINPQDGYNAIEEFLTNFDTIVTNPLLWQWKEEKPNPVYESNNVVVYPS